MSLTIYTQPILLLEAIELIHALVNQIPASQLSGTGPYAIPENHIQELMDAVSREFPLEREDVRFFFLGVPCEEKSSDPCCVARHMVYSLIQELIPDPWAMARKLCDTWEAYRHHPQINGVRRVYIDFSVSKEPAEGFRSLSLELQKLPLPPAYQMQLLEAFSNYSLYLGRLLELLDPVLKRLETFLAPWVQRAQPLLRQWDELFSSPARLQQFAVSRLRMSEQRFTRLNFGLRYLQPNLGYSRSGLDGGPANLLMGVSQSVSTEPPSPADNTPTPGDLLSLRLLSGADRIAMLLAMLDKPMTGMELSQQLGLHSSSVFRDINSMIQVDFLLKEDAAGKKAYRTNAPVLRQLLLRMADLFDQETLHRE